MNPSCSPLARQLGDGTYGSGLWATLARGSGSLRGGWMPNPHIQRAPAPVPSFGAGKESSRDGGTRPSLDHAREQLASKVPARLAKDGVRNWRSQAQNAWPAETGVELLKQRSFPGCCRSPQSVWRRVCQVLCVLNAKVKNAVSFLSYKIILHD